MAIRVHFLGVGDAYSPGGRHHSSYLVCGNATTALLDCGATILTSMKRDGLDPSTIDMVVLSHLHGDHFAGLPYLFLEYTYEQRRQRPLRIAGPAGTEECVRTIFHATYRELAQRSLPFRLEFFELAPGVPATFDQMRVEPFRVPHQERQVSLALRVHLDGTVILYSGDTGWTEDLIAWSQGTDLFICECSYYETRVDYHLDYPRLAEYRGRFGSRRTVLTHLGREVLAHRDEITMEIADDGMVVEV